MLPRLSWGAHEWLLCSLCCLQQFYIQVVLLSSSCCFSTLATLLLFSLLMRFFWTLLVVCTGWGRCMMGEIVLITTDVCSWSLLFSAGLRGVRSMEFSSSFMSMYEFILAASQVPSRDPSSF